MQSPTRMLIVDDNPAIHADIRRIMEPAPDTSKLDLHYRGLFGEEPKSEPQVPRLEFRIDGATQGQEGLRMVEQALASEQPYSVAFVDMRMPPGWDGLETIERIWEVDPDLQVVICTAYSDHSWAQMTNRLGVSDKLLILKKPFEQIEILQAAHTLARKWLLGREVRARLRDLDSLVATRTQQLEQSCRDLEAEIQRREQFQAQLRLVHKMEAVGRLAAGIAHDFNNLLTPIVGNLSLALSDGQSEGLLTEALEAASRAKRLTEQLLTFARGGAPVLSVCDAGRLISECTDLFLRGTPVRGQVKLDPGLWNLHADPAQVSQVLQSLTLNAVEAMGEHGGTVYIEARNLDKQGKPYVEIDVRDSGPGIDPAHLPHIFEPFFTTRPDGDGLGLATVFSIVQQHGGDVKVDSSPGEGACFHLMLPATGQAQASTAMPAPSDEVSLAGRSLLVVDDEQPIRRLVRRVLERLGAVVEEAPDGGQAVDLYLGHLEQGRPFDAIILDLTMPGGMGGAEALGAIRERHPEALAMVISGYAAEALANYRRWGFKAALRKPFTIDELTRGIKCVLTEEPD